MLKNQIHSLKKARQKGAQKLKLIEEGTLVKIMDTSFTEGIRPTEKYKTNLGVLIRRTIFGNVKAVYVFYQDFDGSIKYYIYPEKR